MTIWILDFLTGDVLKLSPQPSTEETIEEEYNGDVESYLNDHEAEIGIRMKNCCFMTTGERELQQVTI